MLPAVHRVIDATLVLDCGSKQDETLPNAGSIFLRQQKLQSSAGLWSSLPNAEVFNTLSTHNRQNLHAMDAAGAWKSAPYHPKLLQKYSHST